ncbi:MAG: hypothetical protein KC656_16140 [Myxococcales bacterium]|nr:hypothetical protein [Myxococcales bacterium]MCB9692022.1 hypothetical protein [Alphaproteobacteria bacterium]
MRNTHSVERFPSFAGALPVIVETMLDDVTEEPTETTTRGGLVAPRAERAAATPTPLAARPAQRPAINREGATDPPAPLRPAHPGRVTGALRRPRPSPLFGEGELDLPQYTMRETVHMGDRPNTLWETDVTDPGTPIEEVAWVPRRDESVTLEVDPAWRRQIEAIDRAYASIGDPVALRSDDSDDDLGLDDLEYDVTDARNLRREQTVEPSPIAAAAPIASVPPMAYAAPQPAWVPPTQPVEVTSLAQRAPAPVLRAAPVHAPLTVAPPRVVTGRVSTVVRVQHALQAAAWFTAGACVFGGTGAAFCLLVVGALVAG